MTNLISTNLVFKLQKINVKKNLTKFKFRDHSNVAAIAEDRSTFCVNKVFYYIFCVLLHCFCKPRIMDLKCISYAVTSVEKVCCQTINIPIHQKLKITLSRFYLCKARSQRLQKEKRKLDRLSLILGYKEIYI